MRSVMERHCLQVVSTVLLATVAFGATTETVLYSFKGGSDGAGPNSALAADSSGNLYGTTSFGGNNNCFGSGCGIVYELSPSANGEWTEKILYTFTGGADGSVPGGVILDSAGNLYGTTYGGGNPNCDNGGIGPCGTVFELSPNANGTWTETVLHAFTGNPDGANPEGGLVMDPSGNLYGTTIFGGNGAPQGFGAVFEVSPTKSGWTESVIYNFSGYPDGADPTGSLIFDSAGNLYGTTSAGGVSSTFLGFGTVFKLAPTPGVWQKTTLYSFQGGGNGGDPASGVVYDTKGNIFGSLSNFANGYGALFELSPLAGGGWGETMLYNFCSRNNCIDGNGPGTVLLDQAGNIYGLTGSGGQFGKRYQRDGIFFELSPAKFGWDEAILYSFGGVPGDGTHPGGLTRDLNGNFFGITAAGGGASYGTVFEITPSSGR
jgi:uncharacterized repeat protein (TIGR03803 family)